MNDHLDERQLNDWADDVLPAAERRSADAHLAVCTACRNAVDGIRRLRSELASLPRDIAPPAHVLLAVHARTTAQAATMGTAHARHSPVWYARPPLLAAAAVLLIALSSGVTALLLRSGRDADAPATATSPVPLPPGSSSSLVAVHAMEQSYEDAIAEVQRALAEQQSVLAPETLRVLQTNLDIIDRALTEARTALHADPGNDVLAELLRSGYERKLDVLRSASSHARARS